jgi:signal transduction histidine kinase
VDLWTILVVLSCLVTATSTLYVLWRPPPPPLFPAVPTAMLATVFFTVGELLSSRMASTPTHAWLASILLYAGGLLLPPSIWTTALRFAEAHRQPFDFGRAPWTRWPWIAFGILFLLVVTNPLHGSLFVLRVGERSEYLGLWYILAALSWTFLVAGVCLFAATAIRARRSEVRSQAWLMASGCLIPVVLNIVYSVLPRSLPVDPSAFGLALACLLFIAGSRRTRLFSLIPVSAWEILRQDSDGIFVLDGDRQLLYANPPAERLLASLELDPEAGVLSRFIARLRRRDEDGAVTASEVLKRDGDGTLQAPQVYRLVGRPGYWVSIEPTELQGPRGGRAGYCLRLRDETALQDANEALAEQQAMISAILVSTDDAFLVTDLEGSVLFVTHRFQEFFGIGSVATGFTSADLAATFVGQIDDPFESVEGLDEVYASPELARRGDAFLADGRTIEWHYYPLVRDGGVGGRIWQIRDVTEQRRLAAEIVERQKLESVGMVASGVAHDFNNLLAVIQGNATLARRATASEGDAGRFLGDIERATERASELTEKLLAYAGKSPMVVEEQDLSAVVGDLLQLLEVSISKRASLACDLVDELPLIYGDVSQLRQMVMSLVLNAAESLSDEAGNVWVRTGAVYLVGDELDGHVFGSTPRGRYVYLEVEDTGCGMSPETVSQIFEPFYSTKFTGRGLGLAATMGVVRTHRGAVCVRSEPDGGSTFTVYIPVGEEKPAATWVN